MFEIEGLAATFHHLTCESDGVYQCFQPGAFDRVLRADPYTTLLVNAHRGGGRKLADSCRGLRLWVDDEGLRFSARIPKDEWYIRRLITSGEWKCSIAWTRDPEACEWERTADGDYLLREHSIESLEDVFIGEWVKNPTTWLRLADPAYHPVALSRRW